MKAILLAATGGQPSLQYGFYGTKPKCLYSFYGEIQLERIINQLFEVGFEEGDIEIVVGFRYQKIINFLKEKDWNIKVKINKNWKKSASYTLLKAVEGIQEDCLLICADEFKKTRFYEIMKSHNDKIFISNSDSKILKEHIPLFKEVVQKFMYKKTIKNKNPDIKRDFAYTKDGVGLALMFWEFLYAIPNYKEIKRIDVHSEEPNCWIDDLDYFCETDEYKNMNKCLKCFYNIILYVCRITFKGIIFTRIYNFLFKKSISQKRDVLRKKFIKIFSVFFFLTVLFSCSKNPIKEETKLPAETLTFQKVYKEFTNNGSFSTADILDGVQGTKTGYTIKSITALNPNDVASPTGTAPAISLTMSKIGVFTATIVLQHNAKEEVTITGAEFQIYSDLLQVSNDGKVTLKSGVDKTTITNVFIPEKIKNITVTATGIEAFKNCSKLTSITIPNSVTSIGHRTFELCISLTSITIPSSVTSIGVAAFDRCIGLTSVPIPNSVTSIGNGAFWGCRRLISVTIPNSITSLGSVIFSDCSKLTTIRVPSAKKSAWESKLKAGNTAKVVGY